jgi:Ca-activated chloride channel family protein
MRRRASAAAAFTLLALGNGGPSRCSAVGAQDTPVSIEPRLGFTRAHARGSDSLTANFRVNSDLVLIPVNVVDIWNRQVLGLTREQFRVYDNQVEQTITHFGSEDAPVSLAIVFDASASMGPKLRKSREAVAELLRAANPEDEFALIEFNTRVRRLVEFTDRGGDILDRLLSMQSKGQTALLDAIYLAVDTMRYARHRRKAIVLISDGGDNCSRYSVVETRQMVREADVQIFALGIFGPPERGVSTFDETDGPALLSSIADETGGRMFTVGRSEELSAVAAQIGSALRSQYLIGYSPPAMERDGKYHRVSVLVQGSSGLRLFWRLGYYAPGRW